jgi:6,7-dimethyl-8-ribityllumazine synthase
MAKAKRKPSTNKSSTKKSSTKRNGNDALHMLIVEARYYDSYSDELLRGAMRVLDEAGTQVDLISVPGALEIPAAVIMALDAAEARRKPYDAVVALGCVIQGETYHFEVVSNESARGLMDISIADRVPVVNGVLTVDTDAQAKARLGGPVGHKGEDAARTALAMARLKRKLAGR